MDVGDGKVEFLDETVASDFICVLAYVTLTRASPVQIKVICYRLRSHHGMVT